MKPFKENRATVIGILFDGIEGTLTYYKDGKCLGVAFKDLHLMKEPLYPIICSTAAKTEVTLCCMRRDYFNLQDRCRAQILKNVTSKSDIDLLLLPKHLKKYLKDEIFECGGIVASRGQQQQQQQLQQQQQQRNSSASDASNASSNMDYGQLLNQIIIFNDN